MGAGQQSAMQRSTSSALKRSLCSGPARTFCAPPRPNKPKPRQLTIDLEPFATIRTNTGTPLKCGISSSLSVAEVVESYAKFGAFCVGMVALVYATSVDVSRSMRGNDMPMTADQIAQLKTEVRSARRPAANAGHTPDPGGWVPPRQLVDAGHPATPDPGGWVPPKQRVAAGPVQGESNQAQYKFE